MPSLKVLKREKEKTNNFVTWKVASHFMTVLGSLWDTFKTGSDLCIQEIYARQTRLFEFWILLFSRVLYKACEPLLNFKPGAFLMHLSSTI